MKIENNSQNVATLFKKLFDYDSKTGSLIWRVTKSATAVAGSIAGSVNARGHVNVSVNKKMYAAHQIVYAIHHGYIPKEIDHINKVKTDNRIENLRECTSSQNKGNIGLLSSNRTGYRGVSLNKKTGFYHAQIKLNGRQTYLGRFKDPEDAAKVYNSAARDHFGDFAFLNKV
jgi:hypothetical protein